MAPPGRREGERIVQSLIDCCLTPVRDVDQTLLVFCSSTRPGDTTREGALVALEEADTPPRILRIVKPSYPPLALQARIGGIVVLRVLVSEKGAPAEVEVVREGRAGLTEAAVTAVRRWTFVPATKDGVAVQTWMPVPIPFEP